MTLPIETTRFDALRKITADHFGRITPAEAAVLRNSAATAVGLSGVESYERPEVRAAFLHWLVTDNDAAAHIDPYGIRLYNATVTSAFEIAFCTLPFPLTFEFCTFVERPYLKLVKLPALYLLKCNSKHGIDAAGLSTLGDVFLSDLKTNGEISFYGAQIGGNLECLGVIHRGNNNAISADFVKVVGGVIFKGEFSGTIRLPEAQIGGDLNCIGATLTAKDDAIMADGAKITGSIDLRERFSCSGAIRLRGAQIGGDLDCSGAILTAQGNTIDAGRAKIAGGANLRGKFSSSGPILFLESQVGGDLDCSGATVDVFECSRTHVDGDLIWMGIQQPSHVKLDLSGSSVARLRDDRKSWPSKGNLHLDGFVYRDLILEPSSPHLIAGKKPPPPPKLDPKNRVEWLKQQPDDELNRPQPWMQLAKLLEETGNPDGAKWVIYEYRRQQYVGYNAPVRAVSFFYDNLEENPLWILVPIVLLWLFGFLIFWRARRMKAMAPTEGGAYDEFQKCGKAPDEYVPFNSAMYVLENVLPVVKLGQDDAWRPNPQIRPSSRFSDHPYLGWTRWLPGLNYPWLAILRWTLILLGWALALVLAAAIGGLFKS